MFSLSTFLFNGLKECEISASLDEPLDWDEEFDLVNSFGGQLGGFISCDASDCELVYLYKYIT